MCNESSDLVYENQGNINTWLFFIKILFIRMTTSLYHIDIIKLFEPVVNHTGDDFSHKNSDIIFVHFTFYVYT